MSEERMIRVELENGRGIFANSSDQINVYMEDTEPVAPKEWRPLCTTFTVYDFETNTCNGFIVKEILEDECINCPYRKKRE